MTISRATGFETDALDTLARYGDALVADVTKQTPLRETSPVCSLVWSRSLAERVFA